MPVTKDFKGYRYDPVTADALEEVDKLLPKVTFRPTQGSYNAGGVAASAGTHDGGGAGDIHMRTIDNDDDNQIIWAMRLVGFAAWKRRESQGPWVEHCHFVRIDCEDASSGAKKQVVDYLNGRNGLASHGADDGPVVGPKRGFQTFEKHMKRARTKVYLSHLIDSGEHDLKFPHDALHPNECYAVERALVREGLLRVEKLDGLWSQESRDALKAYRDKTKLGWADAVKKLGKDHGFAVK